MYSGCDGGFGLIFLFSFFKLIELIDDGGRIFVWRAVVVRKALLGTEKGFDFILCNVEAILDIVLTYVLETQEE